MFFESEISTSGFLLRQGETFDKTIICLQKKKLFLKQSTFQIKIFPIKILFTKKNFAISFHLQIILYSERNQGIYGFTKMHFFFFTFCLYHLEKYMEIPAWTWS